MATCLTERLCPVCEGPMDKPVAPEGWCAECEAIAEA